MTARYSIYSKDGGFITDIVATAKRSYTLPSLGVIGQCEFSTSLRDIQTTQRNFEIGCYLLVRETGLPDWIGVFYPPRNWGDFTMRPTAYQAARVLTWRPTPYAVITGTPSQLFTQIIQLTNAIPENEKQIDLGTIDGANTTACTEQLADHAYAHIQAIAAANGQDFDISYTVGAGGLRLKANWYNKLVINTNLVLVQGQHFAYTGSENFLVEQPTLFNHIRGYSDASTEGTRLAFDAKDMISIARYGYYGAPRGYSNITEQSKLEAAVNADLAKSKDPEQSFTIDVTDESGLIFPQLNIGSIIKIRTTKAPFNSTSGFGGLYTLRVIGMERDDNIEKKISLTVESYG